MASRWQEAKFTEIRWPGNHDRQRQPQISALQARDDKGPTSSHYLSLKSYFVRYRLYNHCSCRQEICDQDALKGTCTKHAASKRNTDEECDSASAIAQTTLSAVHGQIIYHGILSYHNVRSPSCCSAVVPSTAPPTPLHIEAIHILCHNQYLCHAQKSRASILLSYIRRCPKVTWHQLTWFTF